MEKGKIDIEALEKIDYIKKYLYNTKQELIDIKYEIREKLLKRINYDKFTRYLLEEEIKILNKFTVDNKDEEFEKLLKDYEKINRIINLF